MHNRYPNMSFFYTLRKSLPLALTAICLLAAQWARGQANEFVFTPSDTVYTAITPDSTIGTGTSDDVSYIIPLKFSFPFGEFRYTTMRVSANGFVLFGTGTMGNGSSNAYQSGSQPNGRVFNASNIYNNQSFVAFNQDLRANGTPMGIKWGGTAPNRWVVIQYTNFRRYPARFASDQINFQIAVYESGRLESRYGAMSAVEPASTGSMVGIRGLNRSDIFPLRGTWAAPVGGYSNRDSIAFSPTQKPVSGRRFRFTPTPAAPANLRVLAVSPASGALPGCTRGTQETLTITIRNAGTSAASTFSAGYILNNGAPVTQAISLPAPLAPNATTVVTLSGAQGMNLSQFGTYFIKGFVSLAGDVNRRNDTAAVTLNLRAPSAIPTNRIIDRIVTARANGWRSASGNPIRPADSANVWRAGSPFPGNGQISAYFDANNPSIQEWFYRPGLLAGGPISIRFKMGVTLNFSGRNPVSVFDDTLKLLVSRNCGITWETIAAFDQAGAEFDPVGAGGLRGEQPVNAFDAQFDQGQACISGQGAIHS